MISSDLFSPTEATLESRGGMWTAREIAQQPQLWLRVEKLLAAERASLQQFIAPIVDDPAARIVLTGAGTSAFIGQCLQPVLAPRLRCRVDAVFVEILAVGRFERSVDGINHLYLLLAVAGRYEQLVRDEE